MWSSLTQKHTGQGFGKYGLKRGLLLIHCIISSQACWTQLSALHNIFALKPWRLKAHWWSCFWIIQLSHSMWIKPQGLTCNGSHKARPQVEQLQETSACINSVGLSLLTSDCYSLPPPAAKSVVPAVRELKHETSCLFSNETSVVRSKPLGDWELPQNQTNNDRGLLSSSSTPSPPPPPWLDQLVTGLTDVHTQGCCLLAGRVCNTKPNTCAFPILGSLGYHSVRPHTCTRKAHLYAHIMHIHTSTYPAVTNPKTKRSAHTHITPALHRRQDLTPVWFSKGTAITNKHPQNTHLSLVVWWTL